MRRQLAGFRGNVDAARRRLAELAAGLPADARREIAASARRLAGARSPSALLQVLVVELERLIGMLVPLLARTPLPVRSIKQARVTSAVAAGAAAAVSEAEGIMLALSVGAAAPGAPAVSLAWLTAWAVEVWATVSVRARQLEAAGRQVDEDLLVEEVATALMGSREASAAARRPGFGVPPSWLAQRVARRIATRLTRRWAAGLAPAVGIAYDTLDAQRTVSAIAAMPVDGHPPAVIPPT